MKILIIGDWKYRIYEDSLRCGFLKLNCTVQKLCISDDKINLPLFHFKIVSKKILEETAKLINKKIQNFDPDIILFYRVNCVDLKRLKFSNSKKVITLQHHNDNIFTNLKSIIKNRYIVYNAYKVSMNLCYRKSDVANYKLLNIKNTEIFMPYYHEEIHKQHHQFTKKEYDFIYIGHFENDGRIDYIRALINSGFRVFIGGDRLSWSKAPKDFLSLINFEIKPYHGIDYSLMLNKAKCALVFLSKKNKDLYTRRCFEIPLCGIPAFMPDNIEIKKIFNINEDFTYTNPLSLVNLARKYNQNDDLFKILHHKQKERVAKEYSSTKRAREIIDISNKLKNENFSNS